MASQERQGSPAVPLVEVHGRFGSRLWLRIEVFAEGRRRLDGWTHGEAAIALPLAEVHGRFGSRPGCAPMHCRGTAEAAVGVGRTVTQWRAKEACGSR